MPTTRDPRETDAMRLVRYVLKDKYGYTLENVIRAGRLIPKGSTEPEKTWDDLAYLLRRNMEDAGEPVSIVRETVINWATRYGIVEPREPRPQPADQDPPERP